MAKVLQHRRDTTTNLSSVSGAIGEFFMDTTKNTLVVMDGSTNGGHPLALESDLVSNLGDLSNVTLTTPSNGQVLKYNGSIWVNSSDAGIGLSDLSVTTNSAGAAALSYNNSTGAFTYTPPDLSSYVTTANLSSYATTASLSSYQTISGLNSAIDSHLNQSNPSSGHVLSWSGSDYQWVSNAGYTNSDVDSHLNQNNPTSGYVLSWSGSDYQWVAQASGADGNTQYTVQADTTTGGANITLVGNDASTDSIKLAGAGGISITRADASTITIGNTASAADFSAVAEDVLPAFDSVYDLGSSSLQWYDAFLSNSLVVGNSSMTTSSVVIGGATVTGSSTGLVTDTVLIGDILHTTNTLTPDASSAVQYGGDQGVVDINGNLDVSTGDWLLPAVVESTTVTTSSTETSTTTTTTGSTYDDLNNPLLLTGDYKNQNANYLYADIHWFASLDPAGTYSPDGWLQGVSGLVIHISNTNDYPPGSGTSGEQITWSSIWVDQMNDGNVLRLRSGNSTTLDGAANGVELVKVDGDNGGYGNYNLRTSYSANGVSYSSGITILIPFSDPNNYPGNPNGGGVKFNAGSYNTLGFNSTTPLQVSNWAWDTDVTTTTTTTTTVEETSTTPPLTTGQEGSIRYNKDVGALQVYLSTGWTNLAVVTT